MDIFAGLENIYVSMESVDFRKGINGLCGIIIHDFDISPTTGIFIFFNKTKDKVKVIFWHGNGFIMLSKHLDKGRFCKGDGIDLQKISKKELIWLLSGFDWHNMSTWDKNKHEFII